MIYYKEKNNRCYSINNSLNCVLYSLNGAHFLHKTCNSREFLDSNPADDKYLSSPIYQYSAIGVIWEGEEGREGKGEEKGREGKGREEKGREGRGREGKGRGEGMEGKEGEGRGGLYESCIPEY